MPIHCIDAVSPSGIIALWQIDEDIAFFKQRLQLNNQEEEHLASLSDRKALEWISARYLLQLMSGNKERIFIVKDQYGKPSIDASAYHISISHSADMIACIASSHSVGIDIQKVVSKISRIAPKFCNESEKEKITDKDAMLYYHLIWGAKECIYKAYGKRGVDFKKHMHIYDIPGDMTQGICKGKISINDIHQDYQIKYELLEEGYMLVSCVGIVV